MIKKLVVIFLLILVSAGGVYLYLHTDKEDVPVNAAIKAIPINASFIFESRKTLPLWKNISQFSDIWKDIVELPYFAELNKQLKSIDSVVRENPDVSNMLESQPLFISAHLEGMNKFSYLFVSSIPVSSSQSSILVFFDSLKGHNPPSNIAYEGAVIHCIKLDEKDSFYYTISNGVFIASFESALVKESLRQMESGISLMENAYFAKVLNVAGTQSIANLFINFQALINVSSHLVNQSFLSTTASVQNFAEWMELDITSNPDELIMTGFTDCDTTGSQFLNNFQQSANDIKVASVAPANTAFMVCHEFSDYGMFHKNYLQYLGRHNKNRERAEWVTRVQQEYGLNIEKYFNTWINNEVAQIITEPTDSTMQNNTYVLVEASDIGMAIKKLSSFSDTVAAKKKNTPTDSMYMHHEIYNLGIDNVTGNLLGSTFSGVTKSWFTSVGNYVVFANSLDALKTYIYEYEGGNTLEKDSYYKDYIKEHVESESGIYVYNNMALSSIVYSKYLDKSYTADMKKYKSAFSKFHAVSLQFSYLQGMFYTNIYLKRNPMFRKEVAPLWQVALDTTIAVVPAWVTDHITHRQFAFVQDKNECVYLISNTGHIEWKKKINEEIESPVYQVDVLKNRKIQYLFNTLDNIVLLDRNGSELEGFPVKLKSSATAPLNVFDYDNTKNYRLLLPCHDLKIHEYTITGRPVDGWSMPQTKQVVKCAACYCQINKKDYVIFIDDGGKVYALDRKGNEVLNLDNRMPSHLRHFYLTQGKSLSDSYILAADSLGTVFRLSLSGGLSTIKYLKESGNNLGFIPVPADSGRKQEMIFISGTDLYAYNPDKTICFHTGLKGEPENTIAIFNYPDNTIRVGTLDRKNEKIYLWDNTGKLCPGFPLYGSNSFSMADMNGDGSYCVLTGADNKVYVYGLQ